MISSGFSLFLESFGSTCRSETLAVMDVKFIQVGPSSSRVFRRFRDVVETALCLEAEEFRCTSQSDIISICLPITYITREIHQYRTEFCPSTLSENSQNFIPVIQFFRIYEDIHYQLLPPISDPSIPAPLQAPILYNYSNCSFLFFNALEPSRPIIGQQFQTRLFLGPVRSIDDRNLVLDISASSSHCNDQRRLHKIRSS